MSQLDLIPKDKLHPVKTSWRVPDTLPDLSEAKVICIDLETCDPGLRERGPGTRRGSYIAGIAVGTDDGFRGYFPIQHALGGNLDKKLVLRWAKEQFSRPHQLKLGANLLYDLEFLAVAGVPVAGKLYDVQYAEPLLDEHKKSYSLQSLAEQYLQDKKLSNDMYKWSALAYGGRPEDQGSNIYRCPVGLVGPYAEKDVDLPLRIFEHQRKRLHEEGLWDLYEIECGLLPLLLAMRLKGVRVDTVKAERIRHQLTKLITQAEGELKRLAGFEVNVNATDSLVKLFNKIGLKYPTTEKGNPSFTKEWLNNLRGDSKEIQQILTIRKYSTIVGTFIDGYINDCNINGRIYGSFHPLRGDSGGTVSGRMSSSSPNLQNIPARDDTLISVDGVEMPLGTAIRSLFIPEDGEQWCSADYSQVEPRMLLHYASGPVAEVMRAEYREKPDTDFYTLVSSICNVSRKVSKTLSLGMMYGMGIQKLAASLNLSVKEATPQFELYHKNLPFVKELSSAAAQAALNRGYVKTILGRRARFPLFEPKEFSESRGVEPLPEAQAKAKWKNIRRAFCHKALNRIIQGGCADVFKQSLVACWKDGVFETIGAPLSLVHDEINTSVAGEKEHKQATEHMIHLLETTAKLNLPLKVEYNYGRNWGEAK